MKLISLNITKPTLVEMNGKEVLTGIYKTPFEHSVWLGEITLVGDDQADKAVHGGPHQAAYCYPVEHYAYWQSVFSLGELPYGTFGENFTITDLDEDKVHIGDILKIGEALVQVTMPRIPCFKLAHKIGVPNIVNAFLHSGRSGFYLRVLTQGNVKAGDDITIISRDSQAITIRNALIMQKLDLNLLEETPELMLKRALAVESLAPLLKTVYTERLATLNA